MKTEEKENDLQLGGRSKPHGEWTDTVGNQLGIGLCGRHEVPEGLVFSGHVHPTPYVAATRICTTCADCWAFTPHVMWPPRLPEKGLEDPFRSPHTLCGRYTPRRALHEQWWKAAGFRKYRPRRYFSFLLCFHHRLVSSSRTSSGGSDDPIDILEALIESNRQRHKDNEQIGRETNALLGIEVARAALRQKESQAKPGQKVGAKVVEPVPPPSKGKARDAIGKKLGTSGKTAEAAGRVVVTIDTLTKAGKAEEAGTSASLIFR